MPRKVLIIGVSGVTCGGKTTLAVKLNQILPRSKVISQDDYFLDVKDPRHVWIPDLNHINFDIITSLDMAALHADVLKHIEGKDSNVEERYETVPQFTSQHDLQKYLYDTAKESDMDFLIIEGFCIFNYAPLVPLMHLKYYFTLKQEECRRRRLTRIYEPPDCPGYFEMCVWPEHLKQLEEVERMADGVRFFDGTSDNSFEMVMADLLKYL